jgi:hypothetical protein
MSSSFHLCRLFPKKHCADVEPFPSYLMQWLTPVILVIQKMETGRIAIQGWPRQIVSETPSQPKKS